jgi:predicted 2-oxoglutarate/Fe(II)-dependent dioxygenase YbiX
MDENEYKGGDILLKMLDGTTVVAPKSKGCCIAFPSKTLEHKVETIHSGVRKSIVLWFQDFRAK